MFLYIIRGACKRIKCNFWKRVNQVAHEYLLNFPLITGREHWNVICTQFLALFCQVRSIDYNYIQSLLLYYGHQNIIFGLEDEKKTMEDEKKPQIPTLWVKTSRVSKACFPHLFSMSVSLISFSSQATGRSSNWSIATPAFSIFWGRFCLFGDPFGAFTIHLRTAGSMN